MRRALFATAAMNLLAAAAFLPPSEGVRSLMGLPPHGDPVYLTTIAVLVATFGLGYLWAAVAGRAERLFIGVAAFGKLAFFALLVVFWAAGTLPARAAAAGSADLLFAILFLAWLVPARTAGATRTQPA
jgi:hypothetical protein